MKYFKIFFDNVALILCLIFSGWMVQLQLEYYLENDDIASIAFRKIEEGGKDQYPTYTICLFSDYQGIFREHSSSWVYPDITPFTYQNFLRFNLDTLVQLDSTPTLNINVTDEMFQNIPYDEVSVNPFDGSITLLYGYYGTRSNGTEIPAKNYYDAHQYFHRTHQDFKRVCFSKVIQPEYYFVKEMLVFINSSRFQPSEVWRRVFGNEFELGMEIFIHQQGRLYREIPNKNVLLIKPFTSNIEEFHHEFSITGIEVVHRRENARVPCNKSIESEDDFVREMIMNDVGCVPSYWKRFVSNLSLSYALPDCRREQHSIIYEYLENRGLKKYNIYLYPCKEVHFNLFHKNSKWVPILKDPELNELNVLYGALSFHYATEWYKDIVDKQKFTFETLFAQVGGFVGIFLGFSILQLLQTFTVAISAAKTWIVKQNSVASNDDDENRYVQSFP